MPILKTKIFDSDHQWKIVTHYLNINELLIAYFARDRLNNDPNCGIFGVFDGHGGR